MEITATQIADIINGTIEGDINSTVNDFSKIEEAQSGTLTFLANPKYEPLIYKTKASIVLTNSSFVPSEPLPKKLTLIRVENAYESLAQLLRMYDEFSNNNLV